MAAKFLVNKLTEDGLMGETSDMKSILHNLMIIGPKYHDGFMNEIASCGLPYAVQICICGRYVTYIEIKSDLKEGVMRFYDLKNDNDLALDAANQILEEWSTSYYFNWFMQTFEQLKEAYQENYDAAELLLVENAGLLLN